MNLTSFPWLPNRCQFCQLRMNRNKSHLLGFYCPELSTCMLPCPLGAYCMQFKELYDYSPPRQGVVQPLCKSMGMCCFRENGKLVAPTEVTLKNGSKIFKCPGTAKPDPCPKANYCPDPTTKVICKRGHFCPQGSIQPFKCPVSFLGSLSCSCLLPNFL